MIKTGWDNPETPKLIKLADGLFVRQEIDNLTWMDLGGCGLAIDALEHPEKAAEVFAQIDGTLGDVGIRYLLHTHLHYDHVALDAAFVGRFGCEIIDAHTRDIGPAGLRLAGTRRSATIIPMGGAHTQEDCVVWIEPEGVLAVGDIFGWGLVPLTRNLTDETFALLLGVYDRLLAMKPRIVVPGHGPLIDAGHLSRQVEYYHWLRRETLRLVATGASDERIAEQLPVPQDMRNWWRLVKWKHADSVAKFTKYARRGR